MKKKITVYLYPCIAMLLLFVSSLPIYAEILASDIPVSDNPVMVLPVTQICAGAPWPNIVWIHVHDNEETARQTALHALRQIQQGCLLDFRHGGNREVSIQNSQVSYQFDPNRIFTPKGRQGALKCRQGNCTLAQEQLSQIANNFLNQYLIHTHFIVAVHNNHLNGLSVRNYMPGASMAQAMSQIAINPNSDAHDFFYVTTQQAFNFLASRNFNVVLQNNQFVHDDGSLSVWAAQQQIDYINVEAGRGHIATQLAMLAAVWAYMQQYYL
ncbi:hypothetical protein [Snodgrassella sp. ESL0253]|uniref:hypothetical protein n=1 Tax=Snodgrassella sp. ESL0253 TaxID=2705031 RepID=UPI0015824B84|nr:hypothetical protein [Snodgrassella sp. ESL0253]NUE67345.1 hypothetical protein [Snodgrassella sp. ESL0253]